MTYLSHSTAPTALPLAQIITRLPYIFPRGWKESFLDYKDFKNNKDPFQEQLLATLPFYPIPTVEKEAKLIRTIVTEDNKEWINEFNVKPKNTFKKKNRKHIILIHGYGAGLGFYLPTLKALDLNDCELHAIDLPGFGHSSRPKFPLNIASNSSVESLEWFHKRIYRWFEHRRLLEDPEQNIICAHSMGAYIMGNLLLNSNTPLAHKIIMCSPAAVTSNKLSKVRKKPIPSWFKYLWNRNCSPFSLVRGAGPFGSKIVSGWSYRRFNNEEMHRYIYSIFAQRGSGEYALPFFLHPGGDGKFPLEKELLKSPNKDKIQWRWLYGEHDWMDVEGGKKLNNKIGPNSDLHLVPNAGHHIYWDNVKWFNEYLEKEVGQQ